MQKNIRVQLPVQMFEHAFSFVDLTRAQEILFRFACSFVFFKLVLSSQFQADLQQTLIIIPYFS